MKHILKTSLSLLIDQFMASVLGWMFVPFVIVFFKNSLPGYLLAFAICFAFYIYITYHSAFKKGSHDSKRPLKDPAYKGYFYKGAVAGLISAVPLMILYILYRLTVNPVIAVYFQNANMYWTWPLSRAFPNHVQIILILSFLPIVATPWIGYIAGYKVFYLTDVLMKIYNRFIENKKVS